MNSVRHRYIDKSSEIRFDSSECDIIGKETDKYISFRFGFDVSITGFEVLRSQINDMNAGECRNLNQVCIRLRISKKCSFCRNKSRCLSIGEDYDFFICKECLSVCKEMCEMQGENISYFDDWIKVLEVSEGVEFYDLFNEGYTEMNNILNVGYVLNFSTKLCNIGDLVDSIYKPHNYDFVSYKFSGGQCKVCGKTSTEFLIYGNSIYVCEDCQVNIHDSLFDYIEENGSDIISSVI